MALLSREAALAWGRGGGPIARAGPGRYAPRPRRVRY